MEGRCDAMKTTAIQQARVTSVKRAGERLDKSPYQILRMVGCGELESEDFDGRVVIKIDSIDRYEATLLEEDAA
jgi:hypothetical protein